MFKIALNAGHCLYTAGKRCLKSLDPNETREWVLNNRVCDLIEVKLREYSGYELLRIDDTTGEKETSLKDRTDKANKFGADFYLSIHHNAGVKGGAGGGIVAIVYKEVSGTTVDWQKKLYDSLISHTGLKGNRSVPLQKQNLHEVRETKMPAVLLECGFMDSSTDVPIILTDKYADQVATACVEVLVSKGGLSKKTATTSPSKPSSSTSQKTPVNSTKKSVEEIAKEVIAGKWGNGNDRVKRLSEAGYNYAEVQTAVNNLVKKPSNTVSSKSVNEIAKEVIAGKWGNGFTRRRKLTAAGYNYSEVQKAVNALLKK